MNAPGRGRRRVVLTMSFVVVFVLTLFVSPGIAAACHGSVIIRKVETGQLAPNDVHTVVMTDESGQVFAEIDVAAGSEVTIADVPEGRYSFSEPAAPSGASIVPDSITIEREGQVVEVVATNPYPGGRFSIEKVEIGTAAPGGTYEFAIRGPVDLTATVEAGSSWTSEWLPLGTYTIEEVGAPSGATIVPDTVVLESDGQEVNVVATNPYRDAQGRLSIRKVVTGPEMPGHEFTMRVTGPVEFSVTVAAGETWTSGWLPLGTYTVTEDDPFDGHTISPNPVVIDEDGETVLVTVTNPWPAGKISIRKIPLGGAAPGDRFTFDVAGPESFRVVVTAGETWTSEWLELGTYTITEVGGPPGHTISPNPVVLDEDGETVTVTVTNPAGVLPATGGDPIDTTAAAMVLVGTGLLLVLVARRFPSRRTS